jgi:hypothetical protein
MRTSYGFGVSGRYGGVGGESSTDRFDSIHQRRSTQNPSSSSSRWNQMDTLMSDTAATPADEFQREFQSPHLFAQRTREQQQQQGHQAQIHRGGRKSFSTLGEDSSFRAAHDIDAPPTYSLSAMLAATQPAHNVHTSAGFPFFDGRGKTARASSSSSSSSLLPHPTVDVHRGFAHFSAQMQAQHQFDYLAWRQNIQYWRTVAAAIWFTIIVPLVLLSLSLCYTSVYPGWRFLGWGWSLATPLLGSWSSLIIFLAVQAGLLWLRAHAARTDPSPLFQPVLIRLWRSVVLPRQAGMFLFHTIGTFAAGWNIANVLFAQSELWGAVKQKQTNETEMSVSTISTSFLLLGLTVYSLLHAILYNYNLDNLLRFPLFHHQGRTRLLRPVIITLALQAASFAVKFVALFSMIGWRWAISMNTHHLSSDEVNEGEVQTIQQNVPSLLSFAALPALYHLFLLVWALHWCALLCGTFLSVFLTQSLPFHNFFLHALYGKRTNGTSRTSTELSLIGGASSDDFTGSDVNDTSIASSDHLTSHLVLQFLLDLTETPNLIQQRNNALFQPDMNVLFAVPPESLLLKQNNAAASLSQQQSHGMPPALRSTLPPQPAFVPVVLYCMHHLRSFSDTLASQRTLASLTPSIQAALGHATTDLSASTVTGSSSSWQHQRDFIGSAGYTSSQQQISPSQMYSAFVATQLDGAGLLFPSKSQLCAQLFAHSRLLQLQIQLLASLAVDAHTEAHAAETEEVALLDGDIFLSNPSSSRSIPRSSVSVRTACTQFVSSWTEPIVSLLLSLLISLDSYTHCPHFISRQQEQALQGHQLVRENCVKMEASQYNPQHVHTRITKCTISLEVNSLCSRENVLLCDTLIVGHLFFCFSPAIDNALHRIVGAYASDAPEWSLPSPLAAKLQGYLSAHK